MKNKHSLFIKHHIYLFIIIFISFMVAARIFGKGPDYLAYVRIFNSPDIAVEPFFHILRTINLIIFDGNIFFIYLFTSFIALALKLYFLKSYADNLWLSFLFYLCTFFFLHEYTQIRVSVAIGVFLCSIDDIISNNRKNYLIKTIIACMFHASAIIMVFIYIYCNMFKNIKVYILLPWLSFIIAIIIFTVINANSNTNDIVDILITGELRNRWRILNFIYNRIGHFEWQVTAFNRVYISLLIICTFIYFCYHGFKKTTQKNDACLFKILTLSVTSFFILFNLGRPVVISRISEFMLPVISVILPNTLSMVKEKYIFIVVICIYMALLFLHFARVLF